MSRDGPDAPYIIGASLSEPHKNGKAMRELYMVVVVVVRWSQYILCTIPKYFAQYRLHGVIFVCYTTQAQHTSPCLR